MAGKHSKRSQVRSTIAKRGGTGLAAAALSATGLTTAVVTGTTAAVAPNVQLMALVSAANSTSQFFAGSSYYGTEWTTVYGPQQVVPFLAGPQGIAQAISDNNDGPGKTGVTASGWGAGQTGTALGQLSPSDVQSIGLVILDNNTNRAGGGFWTTYYPFAPLLLTTADPTPNNTGAPILDVAYEDNINSDAPVDPLNPFALGNSLAAYVYDYGAESTAVDITRKPDGSLHLPDENGNDVTLEAGKHYVVENGVIVHTYDAPGTADNPNTNTIFVTVKNSELPLTKPLRLLPGGDVVADAIDPTMTKLVNAGYNDGLGVPGDEAIPVDPGVPRPMQPGSSLGALGGVPATVPIGLQNGVATAQDDVSNPGNFITKPLGEVAQLPGISSLTSGASGITPFRSSSANKVTPNTKSSTSSTTGNSHPLKTVADDFSSSLKKFASSLDKKPAASDNGTN